MRMNAIKGLIVGAMLVSANGWAEATRYIVTFSDSASYKVASQTWSKSQKLAELGLRPQGSVTFLNTQANLVRALDRLEMAIVESENPHVIEQLKRHPAVADVEAEIFYPAPKKQSFQSQAIRPTDQCAVSTPWGITTVKADKAWGMTKGAGARVMVLDTGVDKEHPALKSRFEKSKDFTNTDNLDRIGHGTHVAGTIAADGTCLVGVAPEAKILMGKVCSDRGCGSAAIIGGIDWGIEERTDVISMSLGGPLGTPSQQRAVQRAEAAGVVVVAATGNEGVRRISYPAAFPDVIAVGAIGQLNGDLKRAEFSQYGPELDIMAPGVDVVSSVPRGAGRVSNVTLDAGDGKSTRVTSVSFAGAPEIETPVSGQLAYAGLGKPEDFKKYNVRGKFALILRGEIAFKDKVVNAAKAGATGVIIYNNTAGLIRGSIGEDGVIKIPVAMIEKAVGDAVKSNLDKGRTASASIVTESSDYDSYDGTSMATPHVAGVVALVRAANKRLTPRQVREILSSTAKGMGDADEYGSGLVDAEAAVNRAQVLRLIEPDLAAGF